MPFFENGNAVLESNHKKNIDTNRAILSEFLTYIKSEITSRIINKTPTPKASDLTRVALQYIWENIPIISTKDKIKLCDCDREQEYTETLLTDYLEREGEDRNHYYFIAGCHTQKPGSIVTRLLLKRDEKNEELKELDLIFVKDYFTPDTIQIGMQPSKTWGNFWTKFVDCLPSDIFPKDINFDFFKNEAPNFLQKQKRYPLFFLISEDSWKTPNLELHLKEIINKFSTLPTGCHCFSFFFIMEISGLHNVHHQESHKVQSRIQRIKQMCEEPYNCECPPHIKDVFLLNTVPDTEAREWLNNIIDRRGCIEKTIDDYVDLVLECFHKELSEREREYYKSHSAYNMDRLEIMQRHAFQYLTR
jgi:hypothetical protein